MSATLILPDSLQAYAFESPDPVAETARNLLASLDSAGMTPMDCWVVEQQLADLYYRNLSALPAGILDAIEELGVIGED